MVVSKSSLSRLSIIWWFHCRSWEPTLVKRHLKLPMPSMVSSHLSWHEAWIPGKGFAAVSGVTFESRFEAKLWQLFVSWKFVGKTSQKCHGSSSSADCTVHISSPSSKKSLGVQFFRGIPRCVEKNTSHILFPSHCGRSRGSLHWLLRRQGNGQSTNFPVDWGWWSPLSSIVFMGIETPHT